MKCWETPGYTMGASNNNYMNKRDMTQVITEDECSSSAKSCMSMGYNVVGGKMQCELRGDTEFPDPKRSPLTQIFFSDIQLGCSEMDKSACNNTMKGAGNHFECYCKSDYCNGANGMAAGNFMATLFTAVALSVVAMGRSG